MWPGNQLRGLEKPAFVLALESPHRQRATAARNPALRRPCDETVHLPLDAHGCCCPVNWRLLPLPQVTEARMEVPWSPSCPVLLSHNTDLRCEGNAAGYHMPVFVFFWLGTRRAHKCSSAPLYQDLRKTRNGPVPLPVSVFECNWLMSRLPGKMASVIFIQLLPGASCFSLGPCVAMATPAVQSVQRKHSRPS